MSKKIYLFACAVMLMALSLGAVEFKQILASDPLPDETITYKPTPQEQLKLYVYKPKGWARGQKRPVMLMFHGGGWRGGNPAQFSVQCRDYADKGFVAITASYRLASRDDPDSYFRTVADAKSAIRFVRANAAKLGIDPERIITAGSSAGAHLAVSVALLDKVNDPADDLSVSSKPAAVVLMCPVLESLVPKQLGARSAEFSPMDNLAAGIPPQLILLGSEDHLLSEARAKAYVEKAGELGARAELVMFDGAKHAEFYRDSSRINFYSQSQPYVNAFLQSLGLLPAK